MPPQRSPPRWRPRRAALRPARSATAMKKWRTAVVQTTRCELQRRRRRRIASSMLSATPRDETLARVCVLLTRIAAAFLSAARSGAPPRIGRGAPHPLPPLRVRLGARHARGVARRGWRGDLRRRTRAVAAQSRRRSPCAGTSGCSLPCRRAAAERAAAQPRRSLRCLTRRRRSCRAGRHRRQLSGCGGACGRCPHAAPRAALRLARTDARARAQSMRPLPRRPPMRRWCRYTSGSSAITSRPCSPIAAW